MATTNLISKSLGDILTESGNGSPDHTSPIGSIYTNKDTGTLHINVDGSTGWESLSRISYGEMYLQGNTTQTTVSASGTWYSTTGLSWTEGSINGLSLTGGTLSVGTGRAGRYEIIAAGTIEYIAVSDFEVGVSKNGSNPISGMYHGGSLTATVETACINISGYLDLVEGDTLELTVRNTNNTNNVILKHGGIIANRIGD